MKDGKKIRVIIAKPGLDGHDRGAKVVARALMDAGMEVIYLGLRQTPKQIVNAALQESADVIGLSILSGAHETLFRKTMNLLKEQKLEGVLVVAGGVIPQEDVAGLKDIGIHEVFGPGTDTGDIVRFIEENAGQSLS